MEINLIIILSIILIHFFGDFIIQTDWQAKNKSSNLEALLNHTTTYTLCWLPFCLYYHLGYFMIITWFFHTITDYLTSRWVKKSFEKQDYHMGFVKIGLDQCGHYIQLFLTFYFLTN